MSPLRRRTHSPSAGSSCATETAQSQGSSGPATPIPPSGHRVRFPHTRLVTEKAKATPWEVFGEAGPSFCNDGGKRFACVAIPSPTLSCSSGWKQKVMLVSVQINQHFPQQIALSSVLCQALSSTQRWIQFLYVLPLPVLSCVCVCVCVCVCEGDRTVIIELLSTLFLFPDCASNFPRLLADSISHCRDKRPGRPS
uniref:Uncharacterized protein n=1 Tax=Pipistrellus kuhlii TaxID=59472 RepID=A0A7J7VBW6_PIPKU|nr:hypothetical protein mPipKuh1_008536 [Pipistrellus kuhlii]